jgi:hypothetical protein
MWLEDTEQLARKLVRFDSGIAQDKCRISAIAILSELRL